VQRFKNTTERVGTWRSVGHIEESGEEVLLDLSIFGQSIPAIGSCQCAEERHRQDVDQRMSSCPRDSRVLDLAEDIEERLQSDRAGVLPSHLLTGSCPGRSVSIIRQVIEIDQLLMRSPCPTPSRRTLLQKQ